MSPTDKLLACLPSVIVFVIAWDQTPELHVLDLLVVGPLHQDLTEEDVSVCFVAILCLEN